MATAPTARMPLVQRQKNGLKTTYDRHASFAARLISRQANQTSFDTKKFQLVYGLNHHRTPRDGVDHARTASHELMPMRQTASAGIAFDNAATNHDSGIPPFASEGGGRNIPLVHRRVAVSAGASTRPIALSRLITPLASNNAPTSGSVADSISPAGARHNSFTIEPSGHIARNAVLSGRTQVAEIPVGHPPAETHDYSSSSTEGPQESIPARSFIPETAAESVSSKSGFLPGGSLPRSLVQRRPISLHQHPADIEPGQRLPLKMSSMAIARQSQSSRAEPTINTPSRPDRSSVNDQALSKTISRRALTGGISEAGFAPSGSHEYGRRDKPSAAPAGRGIAQSNRTEPGGTDSSHLTLSRSIKASPAMTATAAGPGSDASLITHDLQGNAKMADVHHSALSSIGPAFQSDSIYRSALPPQPDGYSQLAPQQHQVRDGLPIPRNHELQRVSRVTTPGIHTSPFRGDRHDNLLAVHKTIAQRTRIVAANHVFPAPDATETAPQVNRSFARTDIGHDPFFSTAQHSRISLSSIAAHDATTSARISRSQSPSEGIAPGSYLSPQPWHRYNAPMASRRINTQSAHGCLTTFAITPGITGAAPRVDRSIGYADGPSSPASLPLTIHGRRHLTAGYTPALNMQSDRAASDTTAIGSAVATPTTAADFNQPFPAIPGFMEGAVGVPPMLQRLMKNLNPVPLPLSRATSGQATPWPINRQSMSAGNAGTLFTAGANMSGSRHDAKPFQGSLGASSKGTHGVAERPLAVMQRAPAQLMRASGGTTGASTHFSYPATPEDRYGVVPAPNEISRQASDALPGEASRTAVSPSGQPDSDEIAEHAWRMMAERLVIEQERRGLAKWP